MPDAPMPSSSLDIPRTLLTAERARQSFHLARGGSGQRGEIVEGGVTRALWCRRTEAGMRSVLCAIFDAGTADGLLADHRADGAIIRRIGRISAKPGLRLRRGTVTLSLGTIETREILPLPATFDAFLTGLGRVTRAHLRSSLRHMERLRLRHSVTLGGKMTADEEVLSLAHRNLPKPMPLRLLSDCLNDVNAQAAPFRSELRGPDGTLISVVFGYLDGDCALLVCQLNPQDAPKIGQAGCSLLHRALLIRDLIGRGSKALIMVNGCSGMLRLYCLPVMAETLLTMPLAPLSWLRCLAYFAISPHLWTFLLGGLRAERGPP
jgi:hypothetical protein